jgi:hypothetical protein
MVDRGFGIEVEDSYGEIVQKSAFAPDWWSDADSVSFKLGDEPVTKSGTSRMNKRARAGILKPTGSTQADADLEKLAWYFLGFLDNYVYTAGEDEVNTHEYYGGEGKNLPSFRGIAVYDMLKKYIYGMLIDGLKLEASNDSVSVSADWIYKTEKAGIIGSSGETFTRPDELDEEIFLMFYDITLYLGTTVVSSETVPKLLDGVATAMSYEGKNNFDVDKTIGFGSRGPQKTAQAGKRENSISVTTTLTADTIRSILDAEYGQVGALEPSACKILQQPFQIDIALCEDSDIGCTILFPKCTLRVEYDMSGADAVEVTMTLDTLGSGEVTLADGETEVTTDMYVKLVNYQEKIEAKE